MERITYLFQKYLGHTATLEEKQELNEWIASNEKLQQWMETRLVESPDTMDIQRQQQLLDEIHEILNQKPKKQFKLPEWFKYAAAVALIILVTGSMFFIFQNNTKESVYYSEIEAVKGQKTNVILPDGTKVILNSETKLIYNTDFNKNQRNVKLSGEAYFDVARNEDLPFIVNANKFVIQAVGTSFNVRAYDNEKIVSTTLIEGKVSVKTPLKTIKLSPDERIELNTGDFSSTIISLTDTKNSVGWLNDYLSFENATLADVAADLSRIYNIQIIFNSESIKEQRFTGKISNNSLNSVLRIISLTSPIKYKITNNEVVLYEVEAEKELFNR